MSLHQQHAHAAHGGGPPLRLLRRGAAPEGEAPGAAAGEAEQEARDPRLLCRACGTPLARPRDVISLSAGGAAGAYINPHGFVHEILTVAVADNLLLVGGAHTAHSWFPGYAWTIAACAGCGAHAGWRFTAAAGATPAEFWGLRRAALREG